MSDKNKKNKYMNNTAENDEQNGANFDLENDAPCAESSDCDGAAADGDVSDVDKSQSVADIDRESMTEEEYIDALETKLGESLAKINELTALAQRVKADFENYRRRNASLSQEMKELGQSVVIEKLLGVLDNCDLARKYIADEAALTGFNMMESQILIALESFGLEEIQADGKAFDAKVMNAVERVKDEQNKDKVVEVLQKGYKLKGKLLRPASVKVGYFEQETAE